MVKKKVVREKTKKQFLFNPKNPKKSFDVYIDKNPKDTIPIKYTTVDDVKHTIRKLERLYKSKRYPHKRIWQVWYDPESSFRSYVKNIKKQDTPMQKNVRQRFTLANKYFKFLGKRSKKGDFKSRKAMVFKI